MYPNRSTGKRASDTQVATKIQPANFQLSFVSGPFYMGAFVLARFSIVFGLYF
jgi:hypothetical protein